MFGSPLTEKIQKVRQSIIAVGFKSAPDQVNIVGSGFCVGQEGRILSAAHLFQNLDEAQSKSLVGMVMVKEDALNHYRWLPISVLKTDRAADAALLQVSEHQDTLLTPLPLGDPEGVREGQEVYFTGFPYAARLINEGFGITLITNRGIVSAVKRQGKTEGNPLDWFIVDAISNPGNSGCPLFDEETNKVIGIMSFAFRTQSRKQPDLDIREPMHIAGAKPISWAKVLL